MEHDTHPFAAVPVEPAPPPPDVPAAEHNHVVAERALRHIAEDIHGATPAERLRAAELLLST